MCIVNRMHSQPKIINFKFDPVHTKQSRFESNSFCFVRVQYILFLYSTTIINQTEGDCSDIRTVPLSEKRRMAGDAHEGSTGGVWAEDRCRLGLLHVDRLAWSEDARHRSRNMRVSGTQSQDWQLCRFWISIHLWKQKQGGTFTRDTKHVCLHSVPLGTRRPMPFQKENKSQTVDSHHFLAGKQKKNWMRKEEGH